MSKANRLYGWFAEMRRIRYPDIPLYSILEIDRFDSNVAKSLLIYLIRLKFEDSLNSEIVLMALGLLEGYEEIESIGRRRICFIYNSNYVEKKCKKLQSDFLSNHREVHKEAMRRILMRLPKVETDLMTMLSEYISQISDLKKIIKEVPLVPTYPIPIHLNKYKVSLKNEWLQPEPEISKLTPEDSLLGADFISGNDEINQNTEKYKYIPNLDNEIGILIESLEPPINNRLLPGVIADGKHKPFTDFVIESFVKYKNAIVVLHGEGGIGKTYQVLNCCHMLQHETKYKPVFIPAKKLPVIGKHTNPILEYLCNQADKIQDSTIASYMNLCDEISSSGREIVVVIDGIDEYLVNTSTENGDSLLAEIELMQCTLKLETRFIISSRNKYRIDIFDNVCAVEASKLVEEQVREHLGNLNLDMPNDEGLIKIIELPLMLKLYIDIALMPMQIEFMSITTSAQLIERHIDWQLKKYKGKGLALAQYSLKVFLPYFTCFIHGRLDGDYVLGDVYQSVCDTLEEGYFPILTRNVQELNFVTRIKKKCDSPLAAYSNIVDDFLVKQALYITKDNTGKLYWQHELFRDWFFAYAFAQKIHLRKDEFNTGLKTMVDILSWKDEVYITAFNMFPIALFAYDFLKDIPNINTHHKYLEFINAILITADIISDWNIVKKFSQLLMNGIDDYLELYPPTIIIADMLHVSVYLYMPSVEFILSRDERLIKLDYIERHLKKSISIITSSNLICNEEQRQFIESRIHLTHGDYYYFKYEILGRSSDLCDLEIAYRHYKQAYEQRGLVFDYDFSEINVCRIFIECYKIFRSEELYYKDKKELNRNIRNYRNIDSHIVPLAISIAEYKRDPDAFKDKMQDILRPLVSLIYTDSDKRTLMHNKAAFDSYIKICMELLNIVVNDPDVFRNPEGYSLIETIIVYERLYRNLMDSKKLRNLICAAKEKVGNYNIEDIKEYWNKDAEEKKL